MSKRYQVINAIKLGDYNIGRNNGLLTHTNVYGIFAERGLIVGIVTVFGEFYNSNKREKTKGTHLLRPLYF